MSNKFAVGQQVVCTTSGYARVTKDKVYVIKKLEGRKIDLVNDQGENECFLDECFIPYNSKPMFKVGDKVVCINGYGSRLVLGKIYTVARVYSETISIEEKEGELFSLVRFNLYEPSVTPKPDYTGKSLEQVIQERRFGITDECIKAFEKGKARIELLDKTIVGTQKKKQTLLDGVNELKTAFEQKDKPACLVAIHKIGKELKLHFNQ